MSTSPITSNLAALFGTTQNAGNTNPGTQSTGAGTSTGGTTSGGTSTGGTNGSGSTTGTNGLPSGQSLNNMFLQLLVAQLQNQDPTSPVDPSQFVGQLAQFSELSEVTSIYTLLQQIVPASGGSGGSGSGGTTGGTTPTGTTNGGITTGGSGISSAANGTAIPFFSNPSSLAAPASYPTSPANSGSAHFAAPSIVDLLSKIQGVF